MGNTDMNSTRTIQKEWSLGSYPVLARCFMEAAAILVDRAGVDAGDRVLDVACGTGNVAITAHRRGAQVAGVDITPVMLDMARDQASVIDAGIEWEQADAGELPFDDDSFDVTLSCLGHMFVPDPDAAANELVRVTRPGGRIGYVSWTPQSSFAAMMITLAGYLPPEPDASPPPFLWGDPETVRGRLGRQVSELDFDTGRVRYPALSPAHFWDSMTTDAGPILLALDNVADEQLASLREAEIEALEPFFSDADNAMEIEYRLVTATVT